MNKCNFCKYDKISKIDFCEYSLDKCDICEWVRISYSNFPFLIKNFTFKHNFFNLKKKLQFDLFSEKEQKKILSFGEKFLLDSFTEIENNNINCNICNNKLKKMRNVYDKNFIIYYCNHCKSIYFKKDDFEKTMDRLYKIETNWFYFFFKIRDFFKKGKK